MSAAGQRACRNDGVSGFTDGTCVLLPWLPWLPAISRSRKIGMIRTRFPHQRGRLAHTSRRRPCGAHLLHSPLPHPVRGQRFSSAHSPRFSKVGPRTSRLSSPSTAQSVAHGPSPATAPSSDTRASFFFFVLLRPRRASSRWCVSLRTPRPRAEMANGGPFCSPSPIAHGAHRV